MCMGIREWHLDVSGAQGCLSWVCGNWKVIGTSGNILFWFWSLCGLNTSSKIRTEKELKNSRLRKLEGVRSGEDT